MGARPRPGAHRRPGPRVRPGWRRPGTQQAARRWAGPERSTSPPGRPRPERPPRDAPPGDPLSRRRDGGPAVPPSRSSRGLGPARRPDDPYGEQLYGYRDRDPDDLDASGPGGTRYRDPRHDDLPHDDAGFRYRDTDGPAERTGWADEHDGDREPVAPPARRVRRPYAARAATPPGPPAPAVDDRPVASGPPIRLVAVPVAVGALVAVALGVWARQHEGTGVAVNLAGFSSGAAAKAWLGSLALLLAVVQGVTGRMLRRGDRDPLVGTVHRWSGRAAVLVTVPVAVQCLYAFGWSGATTSTLLHSLLGCVFYGAFVTKMLLLRRPGVPGWMLAVCGGLLLAVLAGIWLTSALWFFAASGLSF